MRRYLPPLVAFFGVTALTVTGFILSLNSFRSSVQEEFEENASTTVVALQRTLQEKFIILESMHSLYALFDGRPQPRFRSFVQPFEEELEGVQALQWVVPVTTGNR